MECSSFVWLTLMFSIVVDPVLASRCGCKTMTPCYMDMLNTLQEQDEAFCIEDAAIGTSTLTVFLKALESFCGDVVTVNNSATAVTYDIRNLYEVILHDSYDSYDEPSEKEETPIIVIDAGQEAGTESVNFALYIIEQLVGCEENEEMIQNVKWVILPSTNPDGMEYSRFIKPTWKKNLKLAEDRVSYGVDISRNFDDHWDSCVKVRYGSSANFPGPFPASEQETIFITSVLNKYKPKAKIYLSIRRNGHHIAYPFASTSNNPDNKKQVEYIAAEVASKVNMRGSALHIFANNSIYKLELKPRCGHSVDYAYALGIPWCFEMRVFFETDNRIVSKFQSMPRGYQSSLRNGYMSGIRELYNVLTNKKKYEKLYTQ